MVPTSEVRPEARMLLIAWVNQIAPGVFGAKFYVENKPVVIQTDIHNVLWNGLIVTVLVPMGSLTLVRAPAPDLLLDMDAFLVPTWMLETLEDGNPWRGPWEPERSRGIEGGACQLRVEVLN